MKESCPNCNTEIKSNFITTVTKTSDNFNGVINKILENNLWYCSSCSDKVQTEADSKVSGKLKECRNEFQDKITSIPVLTLQNPKDWNYKPLSMVTSQSVTGTGVFTEISSSITDLLGGQSEKLNSKIKQGENICVDQLRLSSFNAGGNAVIGTDIDYAELGGGKGMIMVCMSGTAINLENTEILNEAIASNMKRLSDLKLIEKELTNQQQELRSVFTY